MFMKLFDRLLDYSIIFSFDKSGFKRHLKNCSNLALAVDKSFLVTGGTSGIGRACVEILKDKKAFTHFVGRNKNKAQELIDARTIFHMGDMAKWDDIERIVQELPILDGVVLNAGGMPNSLTLNNHNIELQCASQLIGHFKLLRSLIQHKKLQRGASVVWVSSGGMYLKELDLKNLTLPSNYDKVDVYANVKRAQVTLVEELALIDEFKDYKIVAMHPGWVATAGLREALPKFYNFFKKRLRSGEEGADTIIWSLLNSDKIESGGFYFDRKRVSAYISKKYIPSKKERRELLDICL